MSLRVVFLGNHTVGVRSLSALMEVADVELVVAHPPDPEDGVRYESVFDFARERNLMVVRSSGKNPELVARIVALEPDLVWTTDYRYLLPAEAIDAASLATVNLHPSLLPSYRGRAALNWAIINGETEVGLTAHLIDEGVDTGPILKQQTLSVGASEDIGDVLRRIEPIYSSMTREVIEALQADGVNACPQPPGEWPIWPSRKPDDGIIDWSKPASEIVNLVRAVAAPYPGARTSSRAGRLLIWRAEGVEHECGSSGTAGRICSTDESSFVVECGEGLVHVTQWELEGALTSSSSRTEQGEAVEVPGLQPGDIIGQDCVEGRSI